MVINAVPFGPQDHENVRRYAEQGFTSVIHGKVWHEETQATASQAVASRGAYLVVFDHRDFANYLLSSISGTKVDDRTGNGVSVVPGSVILVSPSL